MTVTSVVSGLLIGGFYALIALGLSLVFGVLRMINLAHGTMVVGGAYLTVYLVRETGLGLVVVVPVVVAVVGLLAYVLQRGLLNDLLIRDPNGPLVATFGVTLLLQALYIRTFSSDPQSVPAAFATSGFEVAGVRVRTAYLVGFLAAALICGATHVVLTRTRTGARIRAASADPATAQLLGIDVRRLYATTFAIATALSAIAGILVGATFSVTPDSGTSYLLIGFAVVVLGGVGNVAGTFVGALLVGLVQTVGADLFGGGYRDLCVYVVLLAMLTVRPSGLLTKRTVRA